MVVYAVEGGRVEGPSTVHVLRTYSVQRADRAEMGTWKAVPVTEVRGGAGSDEERVEEDFHGLESWAGTGASCPE